ncbi:hypothetical protein [Caviibacter abscessus]|uniref:hypothetical protein n=1 Tax=Caviibacter abscessus TaxID=1766719 RepID=UPI000830C696|nr:hypothetical protein [Caviibacter abscessus]
MTIFEFITSKKYVLLSIILPLILFFIPKLVFLFILSLLVLNAVLVGIYNNKVVDKVVYTTFFTLDTLFLFVGHFSLMYILIYIISVAALIYSDYVNNRFNDFSKIELITIYSIIKIILIVRLVI